MADELKNTTTGAGTVPAGTQKRAPRNDVNGVPRTERLRRPADPNELLTHNQPPRRAIQNRPADPERMGVSIESLFFARGTDRSPLIPCGILQE